MRGVGFGVRRPRVLLREGGDAHAEVPRRPDQADKLLGIAESLGMRNPVAIRVAGRVAAQREHVAHPDGGVDPMTCLGWATEWLTAVRWPTGVRVVSAAIRPVTRTVRSRVDPPAP